jgi:hypothetical protein
MINEHEARKRAEALLRCPSDDPDHPWSIESFPEGWLIRPQPLARVRGQASYVIERASGRVVGFPSSIPPRRIREQYAAVVTRGTEVGVD